MSGPVRRFRFAFFLLLPALALASPDRREGVRPLKLSPCHLEEFREEVLCGTLRVWENRAARAGRTIDIHVAVLAPPNALLDSPSLHEKAAAPSPPLFYGPGRLRRRRDA